MGLLFSTGIQCGCCGHWYRVEFRHKKGELTGYTFRCLNINEYGGCCPTPSTPKRKLKRALRKQEFTPFIVEFRENFAWPSGTTHFKTTTIFVFYNK